MMYCDTRIGGVERWSLGIPKDANMRLPDSFLRCVCFLCVEADVGGVRTWAYGGTGFFVSVPSEAFPSTAIYVYLVTAKHNVDRASARGRDLYMRLNDQRGGHQFVKIESNWVRPTSEAVDVVAIPVGKLKQDEFAYSAMPLAMFATGEFIESEGIGVGDELVVVGLFTEQYGEKRNAPIVRQGSIAAMPGEPLMDEDTGEPYRAYLAEMRSIGGLSGSPVIVAIGPARLDPITRATQPRVSLRLLGVIRGHWDYKQRSAALDFAREELNEVNMGVAIVTPIEEVVALLNDEEQVKQRRTHDRTIARSRAPVKDSAFDSEGVTREEFLRDLSKVTRPVEESGQESS